MSEAKFDWFVPETCEAAPVHAACYTPGPWERYGAIGQPELSKVRGVISQDRTQRNIYVEIPANPQDARLIAAAPELLEACRLAIDVIGDRLCTNKIQAAIDKATKGG